MSRTAVEALLAAHRAGDLRHVEEHWLEVAEAPPEDLEPLLKILDELVAWGDRERALAMAEMLLAPLEAAERWRDVEALALRILALKPEADLGETLARAYRVLYADCEGVELFLERSRLRFARPVGPALERFRQFLAFRRGDVVLHEGGWGVGIVQGHDPVDASLIVDFPGNPGHRFQPEAAPRLLKKLDPEDFRALRARAPERLQALAREDPTELVRRALAARGGKATVSRLKSELVPAVLAPGAWSGWWTRTRRLLQRDPYVALSGQGTRATLELREVPLTPVEEALAALRRAGSRREQVAVALAATDPEVVAALREAVRALPAPDPAAALEYRLLAEALAGEETAAVRFDDPEEALRLLPALEHPEMRRRAFAALRASPPPEWGKLLEELFFRAPPDLWEPTFAELARLPDGAERQEKLLTEVLRHSRRYLDQFGWAAAALLAGRFRVRSTVSPATILSKLLDAVNHLYRHHAEAPDYRERLQRLLGVFTAEGGKLFAEVLAALSREEAWALKERIQSCMALPARLQRDLGVQIARRHGAAPAQEEAAPAAPAGGDVIWTTAAGLERQRAAYHRLVNEEIPAGQRALQEAASHGDLSENAEWSYALEQQTVLSRKAEAMERELARARVIRPEEVRTDRMGLGTRGYFREVESGRERVYTLLGPWESDPERGVVAYDSPLGRQLLGRKPGEAFLLELPGERVTLRLVRVENALTEPNQG